MPEYHECHPPLCRRLVSALSIYCCTPCGHAIEHKYEIDKHSAGCDERAAARTPLDGGRQ